MAPLRHLTSINDLSNAEVEQVFALAGRYLKQLGDPALPSRIGKSTDVGRGYLLATLFYEPSTRTRLSFESAMLRLGGKAISSADPNTSSAAKGESLADSVRMVSNYADAIVIRHPRDGAARLAAEYAHVPVINGGDGAHEHPTQTLGDLFTLRRDNKKLEGLNVAVSGDLKANRSIHSFVYALARFGANIIMMPAKGMDLPEHVHWRLCHELGRVAVPKRMYNEDAASADVLYVTATKPHQLSLISNPAAMARDLKIESRIDAIYVTRFQKERWAEGAGDYPRVDLKFLKDKKYAGTLVLHPLPRVNELDIAVDADARAVYFQQAAYAVPVRMALLSLILGLDGKLKRFAGGFPKAGAPLYDQPDDIGIRCANERCIVHEEMERKHTRNKFYVMPFEPPRLRCFYCETDIENFVAVNRRTRRHSDASAFAEAGDLKDIVFYADDADARAHGFEPKKAPARRKAG